MNKAPKNILLIGANGQLGRELINLVADKPNYRLIAVGREKLDITDKKAVMQFIPKQSVDIIINTAAYTKVDQAEKEIASCYRTNVSGVEHIVQAIQGTKIVLVHLSSDYVYHNRLKRPLKETDPTTPKSVYAMSKLFSEYKALKHPYSFIIRTSWIYGPYGNNFLKTMLRIMGQQKQLNVVNDQIGQPTYSHDLAHAVLKLIDYAVDHRGKKKRYGIYNFANKGPCSWYDFAVQIAKDSQNDVTVQPIETSEYPTPAQRPPYSVLDCTKYEHLVGTPCLDWEARVGHAINRLRPNV